MNAGIEELKSELTAELNKSAINHSRIIELSTQIASHDENSARFSIDAGIISRLGMELVARSETALSELVKNAYDADATTVNIYFKDYKMSGGTLTIEDNGSGMSRDTLINSFMRLSSTEKIRNPVSKKFNRKRSGRKGIGRFSAQRLGRQLTILTKSSSEDHVLRLRVNWDDYLAGKDLSFISNNLDFVDSEFSTGTTLIIEGLRDAWTDNMMKDALKSLRGLLQPFPLSKKIIKNSIDPGMSISIFRIDGDLITKVTDNVNVFKEYALAEIEGYVDFDGTGYYSISSDKLGFHQDIEELPYDSINNKFPVLRNIHLKVYYFIFGKGLIPKALAKSIHETVKDQGGIRLYRNGFRVPPYGEPKNDWLGLDASATRRSILPPHANTNFLGFIEIMEEEIQQFEELSSREGLIDNDAFTELKSFAYNVLTESTKRIAGIRDKKVKGGTIKATKSPLLSISKILDSLDHEISKSVNNTIIFDETAVELLIKRIKNVKTLVKQQTEEYLNEINMLRVLSSLGLLIGEFVHEIKRYPFYIASDIKILLQKYKDDPRSSDILIRILNNMKNLSSYTAYFDESISTNVSRELKPIELRDVVNAFIKVIKNDTSLVGIDIIDPQFKGYDLFTGPMHSSEWSSILFNLYSNSKKSIKKQSNPGRIFIKAGKLPGKVYLEFMDNGIGLDDKYKDRIFDAFFTTSVQVGSEADGNNDMAGSGLGLKIVKDIITSYGGSIFVSEPDQSFNFAIRIELPLYKESTNV